MYRPNEPPIERGGDLSGYSWLAATAGQCTAPCRRIARNSLSAAELLGVPQTRPTYQHLIDVARANYDASIAQVLALPDLDLTGQERRVDTARGALSSFS